MQRQHVASASVRFDCPSSALRSSFTGPKFARDGEGEGSWECAQTKPDSRSVVQLLTIVVAAALSVVVVVDDILIMAHASVANKTVAKMSL